MFMNTENGRKTNEPQKSVLNLSQRLHFGRSNKHAVYSKFDLFITPVKI